MRNVGSFLLGALIGGVIGSSIGLLLAPASGPKLRDQIRDYMGTVRSEITRAANTRRAQLEQQLAQMRSANPPQDKSSVEVCGIPGNFPERANYPDIFSVSRIISLIYSLS